MLLRMPVDVRNVIYATFQRHAHQPPTDEQMPMCIMLNNVTVPTVVIECDVLLLWLRYLIHKMHWSHKVTVTYNTYKHDIRETLLFDGIANHDEYVASVIHERLLTSHIHKYNMPIRYTVRTQQILYAHVVSPARICPLERLLGMEYTEVTLEPCDLERWNIYTNSMTDYIRRQLRKGANS